MQKSVGEIFNNQNVFSIPNYQRDYAWGKSNVEDLWDDLQEAKIARQEGSGGHFLGTIVVARNPNNPEIYDIIDGQQRATTLFLLRYALNQKLSNPDYHKNNFIQQNDNLRLLVIENNREFFASILKQIKNQEKDSTLEKQVKTQGHKQFFKVFSTIWDYTENIDSQEAQELLSTLDTMTLMWLEEKNSGRAIRMFQTVNDRGVPLLILDKLKALLILYSNKYCNGELDDTINERFGEIFITLMEIQEHKVAPSLAARDFQKAVEARLFTYHARGIEGIGDYRYGANETYKTIKNKLKRDIQENKEDIKTWIDWYSNDLLEFCRAFLRLLEKTEKNIETFKIFMVLKINPFFYTALTRLEIQNMVDDEILKLFAQAEILMYGLGSTNDSRAYSLYKYTENKEVFKKGLMKLIKKSAKGGYRNMQEAIEDMADSNYGWNKYFHYLFLTYRSQMSKMDTAAFWNLIDTKNKTYSLTIEHIISQNVVEHSLNKYGFKDKDDFGRLKDTFGNLLALESSLNSEALDAGLAKKQDIYKKSRVAYNRAFASSANFLDFNKQAIWEQNEKFTSWAREFFNDFI